MRTDAAQGALVNGWYALDEAMVSQVAADGQARAQVYPCPLRAVVLGRGSRPEIELKEDAIRVDGVAVLRRAGGGCAVWLDPGNLIVSLALPLEGLGRNKEAFAAISTWLRKGLAALGIADVAQRGHSDLCLGERKVGGACIHRSRNLLTYSTTLLVAPDVDGMERYLRHPPREPEYRQGRTHRDFVGRLVLPGSDVNAAARSLALALGRTRVLEFEPEVLVG